MKVKAIAPWFGGKRLLAPRIVRQLGEHVQYFEPFCGGLSVLFAKPVSKQETVNDLHGDVVNLARVVADPHQAPNLFDRLQRTLFAEPLLYEAQERLDGSDVPWWLGSPDYGGADENMAERAYWYFLACWMTRNGTAGTERINYQAAVRWTANGGSPTVRWRNAVASLPAWHERLQNVVILCRDAFSILDRFEDVSGTAIYVDPPYPAETRANLGRKGGDGGRYKHEFDHADSEAPSLFDGEKPRGHALLADILHGYKRARIVVSSYDCDMIRDLYPDWTVISCPMNKQLTTQNRRGARGSKREAPEVLLVNGAAIRE